MATGFQYIPRETPVEDIERYKAERKAAMYFASVEATADMLIDIQQGSVEDALALVEWAEDDEFESDVISALVERME